MVLDAVLQRFMLGPFAVFPAHKIVIVPSWVVELGAITLIQIIVVVIIQQMIRLLLSPLPRQRPQNLLWYQPQVNKPPRRLQVNK